jgi:hypothetical protein
MKNRRISKRWKWRLEFDDIFSRSFLWQGGLAFKRKIWELILHLNVCVFTQVRFVIYEEKQKVSVVANIHFDSSFLRI